jgi:hypothetical protein
MKQEIIYTFGVKKAKISPQSPITGFGLQNLYGRLYESRLNIFLVVKKMKIRLQNPKTVRRLQYQYSV